MPSHSYLAPKTQPLSSLIKLCRVAEESPPVRNFVGYPNFAALP